MQPGAPVKLDEPSFDETVIEPTSGEDSAAIESPLTPEAPESFAIVVAIGSLFMNSPETNIDIWLIGDIQRGDTQAQALNYTSLLNRLETALMPVAPKQTIHVMDIDEATATLEKDGVSPLWKWPQFGSQGGFQDQDHQPPTILHPEPWDYDNMHHDPFNMLRFYLPYLGPFRGLETLFFCDDDIVIQKPIASLEIPMGEGIVIAGTCNGWLWDEDCMRNKPYVNAFSWVDYPVTYLGKDKASGYIGCTMSAEESGHRQCQKDEFAEIIMQWSRDFNGRELNATAQPKWNFGMSRFNMTEWRAQNMTDRFDNYMRANYEKKLLPETSLSFGLGISYFAFADTVVCWNSLVGDPAFVDGLGYISKADLNANKMNASKFLGDATVLHWSGRNKPFDPKSEMDPEIYKPFDDVWDWMQENGNIEDFGRQTPDETQGAIRGLLYADQHSGAEWFLELLDETKELCAAGGTANPTAAFAGESFIPPHFEAVQNDIPICALKLSCLWSFVAQNVPRYMEQRDKWCLGGKEVEMTEVPEEGSGDIAQDHYAIHDRHGETLCNWVDKLLEMYPNRTDYTGQDPEGIQLLWRLYEENVFGGSRELVPCTQACGVKPGRMLKYMRTWSQPQMSDEDKSRPMYIQHESQDGIAPKYFIGDFSGANCDGSSLPFGGCTGSENYLPAITWETYKIVELTRWNLVDRCLVESPFARGITEDPTATIDLNFKGEKGEIVFDDLLHCMRDSAAQQIADKTRTNVFVNETAKNWKLIHYEYCAVPSHIQPCVDAVVAHVVDKHSVAAQSYNFDPNFAMLDDMTHHERTRSTRWLGISNAEEVTAGLIHGGFAIFVQPIYCFAWQKNANGVEISKYLAQLPPQYIVPGSRPFEPFDLKSFTASFDESVDGRTHALIAFGQIDNVTWVQELRAATNRPVVVLGFMRDVLSHRIQAFFADDERRHMANRSSVAFIRAMMHSWMNSDDYPQDAQLQYVYEFNETWRNMTIDALWNARNSSAISSGADADRDSPLASVYLGPVGDPQNIRRSLCIFAHATQLPIPWKIYETDNENRNGIVPSKYIATVDEDVASVLLAKEKREFFFVARALDAFEAFAESYGCLATPTDTAIALPKFGAGPLMVGHETSTVKAASTEIPSTTAPVVQYTRTFVGSVPTDFPLYYFHHVPKTGGTTLSEYLLKLPAMWTVPGSERSDGFNMTRYLAVEDEVCSRMNALIAFSHMQTRTWLNNILPTKLGMRKIETIFMLRDILPHRISFFHEMVGPEAHGADQEELDVGKTVHRPYLEFQEWAAKDDDPKHTNMSWLTNNSGEALDIAPIAVAECIRNKMCRNPRMDDNQLRSIYKLNFAWVKVPVQDFFNQLHAKAPLESCSSSKAVGKDPVFFRHCPNAAADVGLALIGHLALMRETLCLMDRMLGIPVVYNGVAKGGMNWRFKALRPMDAEKSFNSSSAHFLLTRQRRELIFNSMTFATVLEQASAYGCIPPLPAPAPEEPATILPAWAGTAGMEPAWQASSTDEYQCYEPPPMLLEIASGAADSFNALGADDFGSGSGEVLSGSGEVRDETEFSVPNFHDVTYVARYKRAHEAVAAKLKDLRVISTGVKLLYLQASLGTGLLNKPVYFNPNRTEADYVWTDSSGQPTPADVAWNPCGSCLFDADAPPRNTTLDALWCPSGATTNGLLVPRRPAFEEFAQDMTAFLYDNVYASLRVNDGLRLMVTMDEPHTWVNLAIGNATAAQTKERMREAQLFNDDWVDSHTPGLWVMRSKEGQGTGLIGERTRVAHSILNIYRVTKEGPVRGRADLDKFWCWTAILLYRQRSICKSFQSHGCRLEIDPTTEAGLLALAYGNGTNDVNLDVWRSDYGMYMQRRNTPESKGYWWQGPADQLFGRYSRGFAHPQATIEMVLDQGLWGGLPLIEARNLTLRVVYFDNAIGHFYVGYDALDGPRGWTINTTNTLRWREVTLNITDGRFARGEGGGPNGADVWLRDLSSCSSTTTWENCYMRPTLFDSLEVVELTRDQAIVEPVLKAFINEPSTPTPPELVSEFPAEAPWMPGTAEE
ncbi:hypothetical protein Ctob_005135 [Chrysochromulina tobinii]|uniref:Uncharacterized protein n=1 Tax=Chrysochromulina tobinii TaxID=1460289 RepID=A0A0M0JYG2_9EUKA|nr:hypothetical protein Ctob_005135 [Chrysochromulina tobinii]|eukprot:KOO31168.1 hypothetical protein Ctob_005135 [Chrysochromulina sp. CCMP291]